MLEKNVVLSRTCLFRGWNGGKCFQHARQTCFQQWRSQFGSGDLVYNNLLMELLAIRCSLFAHTSASVEGLLFKRKLPEEWGMYT